MRMNEGVARFLQRRDGQPAPMDFILDKKVDLPTIAPLRFLPLGGLPRGRSQVCLFGLKRAQQMDSQGRALADLGMNLKTAEG